MPSFGQEGPQPTFDKANELLNSGEYEQAITLYQQLESRNQWSGALFLNLGISYQRIDSLGKAKFYYLRSAEFEETASKAQQALNYVNDQFSHQSAVLPKLPWDVATTWLQKNIGASILLAVAIIVLNIGILLFIVRWFIRWIPSFFRMGSLGTIGLALLVMATAFYTQYVSDRYRKAVMVTEKVAVVEKPSSENSVVSQAFEGYTFTVDHRRSGQQPNWSYVRMSNGLYGWIPSSEIMIL
jgi:tetratricopeptide (TPR) repeat protein